MDHEKQFKIIVNGVEHEWSQDQITYQQVVDLAFNDNPPGGDNVTFTVEYFEGPGDDGFLSPSSKALHVIEDMKFRVHHSTRS